MKNEPSQDPAPGARGGGAPASPSLGGPVRDALPVEEGWGLKALRRLLEKANEFDRKAIEWILVIVLGSSLWVLLIAPLVF